MKSIHSIIFLILTVQTKVLTDLEITHISVEDSLYKFTFVVEQPLDLDIQITQQTILSRTILENIHAKAGVNETYISFTQGRVKSIMPTIHFPTHGITILSNDGIHKQILINQLSELFRITKHNILNDPAYSTSLNFEQPIIFSPFGYEESLQFSTNALFYAQDPTDVICVDTIECDEGGLLGLVDQVQQNHNNYPQNKLFQSSYTSLQAFLKYNHSTHMAYQKFVLLAIVPTNIFKKVFNIPRIEFCHFHSSAVIHHTGRETSFDLQTAQYMSSTPLKRSIEDKVVPLTPNKYSNNTPPHLQFIISQLDKRITQLGNGSHLNPTINIGFRLFLMNDLLPIFSTLSYEVSDEDGKIYENDFQVKIIFGKHYKRIELSGSLLQNQYLIISIKFDKKLKSFEEYPHDPERGHDLISQPVLFQPKNGIAELFFSENQVTRLPAPDFSMPFNILTYTCLTLGYYFLQILKLSVDKQELDLKEKGSLVQRVMKYVWGKFLRK